MGGVSVLGSEPRLIQLLDKLLENAVAHSSASSEIRLSLTISNGLAVLAVENQGSALPFEPERLFEPFVSEAKGRQNLGLGLFVVRRITELHAGRVRALPLERGCGVRFEVSLPRIETQTSGSSQR
jgi:NtrC-family two-component system sensor histidine kinase KinB